MKSKINIDSYIGDAVDGEDIMIENAFELADDQTVLNNVFELIYEIKEMICDINFEIVDREVNYKMTIKDKLKNLNSQITKNIESSNTTPNFPLILSIPRTFNSTISIEPVSKVQEINIGSKSLKKHSIPKGSKNKNPWHKLKFYLFFITYIFCFKYCVRIKIIIF